MDDDSASPAASASRVDDPALRTAFGLDRSDDEWLAMLRGAAEPANLGRLGPYRLLAELGRGGQGSVYKAVRDGTDEAVAIKRLPLGRAGAAALARFEREREAMAMLSHPGIVGIRGVELIDGQPLLAMELVHGLPIDRWAGALAERPVRPILQVFLGVCDAVAYAHRRGVLHRDLKPSNIFIDDQGRPRILDLGLAKVVGTDADRRTTSFATAGTAFLGTPAFAAPEQVAGDRRAIDTRTDVYALGVVLYVLLTGALPFDTSRSLPELFDQVRHGISTPPSMQRPGLGRELDAITLKAAALEPARRYASVDDLIADLRRYLAGQTVLAHPPTAAYRLSKLWRRHRVIAPILALAGVGVIMLSVVSTVLAWNLREQRDQLAIASDSASRAREAAERALDESRKQADRHQAAAQFLSDMLNGVHEAYLEGRKLHSRDMVDHAARRLDAGELANQPEVEAQLLYAVGRAYFDLDCGRDSARYIDRALERCLAVFGPDHLETGRCEYMRGLLAERQSLFQDALELYTRARVIAAAAAGEEDLLTLQLDNNIGCVLQALGRLEESEAVHRRTMAARIRVRGTERHRDVVMSYRNLATTLGKQKRFEEADAILRMGQTLASEVTGPATELSLGLRQYEARLLIEQGRHEEALQGLVVLVHDCLAALGEEHRLTIAVQRHVFQSCNRLQRWEEGLPYALAARAAIQRTSDGFTTALSTISVQIADVLRRLGRFDEARHALDAARAAAAEEGEAGQRLAVRIERSAKAIDDAQMAASSTPSPTPLQPNRPVPPDAQPPDDPPPGR